jgi:hypothetical protein
MPRSRLDELGHEFVLRLRAALIRKISFELAELRASSIFAAVGKLDVVLRGRRETMPVQREASCVLRRPCRAEMQINEQRSKAMRGIFLVVTTSASLNIRSLRKVASGDS